MQIGKEPCCMRVCNKWTWPQLGELSKGMEETCTKKKCLTWGLREQKAKSI